MTLRELASCSGQPIALSPGLTESPRSSGAYELFQRFDKVVVDWLERDVRLKDPVLAGCGESIGELEE
jgi:hypothetical protein